MQALVRWGALTLCLLFISSTLKAQLADTVLLNQVEVVARIPEEAIRSQRQKLDTVSLQMSITEDMGILLRQNSSVYVKTNSPGGLSTVSFRGTGANHTMVLWNGFPINSSQHGQVDFSLLPVFIADQIELAWANTSDSYKGGLGGTVSLTNNASFNKGWQIKLIQSAASFSNYGSFADILYSTDKIQLHSRLFNRMGKNDFTFLNTASWPKEYTKQQNASFYDKGFLQEINWLVGKSKIGFQSWNQWNDRNLPAIMTNLDRGGQPKEQQNENYSRNILSYKYYWQKGSAELSTALFFNNMDYELLTRTQIPPFEPVTHIQSRNESVAWMNQLKMEHQWTEKHGLSLFMAFDEEQVRTSNYAETANRKHLLAKLSSRHSLSESIKLRLSLQHNWINGAAIGLIPALNLDVFPWQQKHIALNFSAGTNYRLPGMNDLHWYPGGRADLKPEKAKVADMGIRHQIEKEDFEIESRISAYYSVIDDWILWRPSAYRYWMPENIAKVKARGLEVFQRIHLKSNKLNYYLSYNYAYTVTTDESAVASYSLTTGRQLIYIPRHHANAIFRVDYGKIGWYYQFELTGSRYTNYSSQEAHFAVLPTYALHHTGLNVRMFKQFDLQLSVNNLFDKSYQAVLWRPMPGRHYQANLIFNIPFKSKTNQNENY